MILAQEAVSTSWTQPGIIGAAMTTLLTADRWRQHRANTRRLDKLDVRMSAIDTDIGWLKRLLGFNGRDKEKSEDT